MLVLGIESSCDDTAAAIITAPDHQVLASVVSSQFSIHAPYGGIVPELASRCHIQTIWPVLQRALDEAGVMLADIDLIGVTQGPGLVGSLLVGLTFAKSLALATGIPCVGVDHMEGHLLAVLLNAHPPALPYTALVVSGGHTNLYRVENTHTFSCMGRTRDDAAGEAFDKVAKLLELGYPGGPAISRLATRGNPAAQDFPRAWMGKDNLDFSFSGLKTAVATHIAELRRQGKPLAKADICASFQKAVVDVLTGKTILAARMNQHQRIVLGGGVAANPCLRETMHRQCETHHLDLFLPPPELCTDNGAMIALAASCKYTHTAPLPPDGDAYSRSPLA